MGMEMNIARILFEFREKQELKILGDVPDTDMETMNIISIEILSWLRLERKREMWIEQGRRTAHKPLELNMNYPWCTKLLDILQSENALTDVFCIEGNMFNFKAGVSDEYIHESRVIAYEEYTPKLIIG